MDFIAIDVETANADMASICQIGLACFENDMVVDRWSTFINPEDEFDSINIEIHGIDENKVKNSPTFPDIAEELSTKLKSHIVVCHTHFDRVALRQVFTKYNLPQVDCIWLDTARVARRAWTEFAMRGYGLSNICKKIGYSYQEHDALEDAIAAGIVLVHASKITGLNVVEWLKRVERPINTSISSSVAIEGNREGALYGEVLVFTGALEIPRHEAAKMAANIGCRVASGVTSTTTILVVGDQDIVKLAGHDKSSKHRKAEKLISEGASLRILRETDFKEMVEVYHK